MNISDASLQRLKSILFKAHLGPTLETEFRVLGKKLAELVEQQDSELFKELQHSVNEETFLSFQQWLINLLASILINTQTNPHSELMHVASGFIFPGLGKYSANSADPTIDNLQRTIHQLKQKNAQLQSQTNQAFNCKIELASAKKRVEICTNELAEISELTASPPCPTLQLPAPEAVVTARDYLSTALSGASYTVAKHALNAIIHDAEKRWKFGWLAKKALAFLVDALLSFALGTNMSTSVIIAGINLFLESIPTLKPAAQLAAIYNFARNPNKLLFATGMAGSCLAATKTVETFVARQTTRVLTYTMGSAGE